MFRVNFTQIEDIIGTHAASNSKMRFSRRAFLLGTTAATAALSSCYRTVKRADKSLPPLVFIPGIKGSVLSDPQGVVRWFTLAEGLGLESPDLRLPLQWQENVQQRDELMATAPLRTVGWHDVYAP